MPKWISVVLAATVVLTSAACSTAPSSERIAEAEQAGQRELDTHLGGVWVAALDHPSLKLESESVTPRSISRNDAGLFGPFYNDRPTRFTYVYHRAVATADLETVHSELVATLEASGATILENSAFEGTTTDGMVASSQVHTQLEVDSLGDVLTISLITIDWVDEGSADDIRHTITINGPLRD